MRAVVIPNPGSAAVLQVADLEPQLPGEGQVRIAVKAAAVNPADVALRESGRDGLPAPWIPGMDAAGIVESVGTGVDQVELGQPVMAIVIPMRPEGGAQQELVVVPAASVVPIPERTTLAEAATLPMNGLTARLGLEMLALQAGESLAVAGGAGLLASYVIGMAKDRGLHVIADAKPDDEALVRSFGADVVIARNGNFGKAVRSVLPSGADGLYDTASLYQDAVAAVRDGGQHVVVQGWDGDEFEERGIRVHPVFVFKAAGRTDWLRELRTLVSTGRIKLRVAREFPPEHAAEAHRLMESGGLRGRAVISF